MTKIRRKTLQACTPVIHSQHHCTLVAYNLQWEHSRESLLALQVRQQLHRGRKFYHEVTTCPASNDHTHCDEYFCRTKDIANYSKHSGKEFVIRDAINNDKDDYRPESC